MAGAPVVVWVSAVLGLPAADRARGLAFWEAVTGTGAGGPSATGGRRLLPPAGDAFLEVVDADWPGVSLVLHTERPDELAAHAQGLGAVPAGPGTARAGLASPGGLPFAVVAGRPGGARPGAVVGPRGGRSLVDQVCLDLPPDRHDDEVAFWGALTGWAWHATGSPELSAFVRPPALPIRLLLQRLGDDDGGARVRAHLDLACGPARDRVVAEHRDRGAAVLVEHARWTVLRDPVGGTYCLTDRDPVTGRLAP